MSDNKILSAIGLMSGTSMDGIDVALIESNGQDILKKGTRKYYPYSNNTRSLLYQIVNEKKVSLIDIKNVENIITNNHIEAILDFLAFNKIKKKEVDIIGFHGHTILHNPEQKITWQIGNGACIANRTGINVIADFRSINVITGGQGAPLVPLYHLSLFKYYDKKPLAVINIGGVANMTYIYDKSILAFDICFGNSILDDLVRKSFNKNFDDKGEIASRGNINYDIANKFLSNSYFKKIISNKSLDRNYFKEDLELLFNLKVEDALKTAIFILATSINNSLEFFQERPLELVICGGGRKNKEIMRQIYEITKISVSNIDDLGLGFDGDFIEAEAFAFLAIRSYKGLPIFCENDYLSNPKKIKVLKEKYGPQISEEIQPSSYGGVFYRA